MDFTFKAQEEDFTGTWPAVMHIENLEYTGILFYAGAEEDPSVGEYAADRAAGRLKRRYLTFACEPKRPLCEVNLTIEGGMVGITETFRWAVRDTRSAKQLLEDLKTVISSAEALDDFITARFGPLE